MPKSSSNNPYRLFQFGHLDGGRHALLPAFLAHDHVQLGAEPVGDGGTDLGYGQDQAAERRLGGFDDPRVIDGPARLRAGRGLYGSLFTHGLGAGMDDDGLGIDAL